MSAELPTPYFAIIRQGKTPKGQISDPVCELLRLICKWDPTDGDLPEWVGSFYSFHDARNAFPRASDFVEHIRSQARVRTLTVIVDEVDPFRLNPLEAWGWSSLIAMLILAFPDVDWLFASIVNPPAALVPHTSKPDGSSLWQTDAELQKRLHKWQEFACAHSISNNLARYCGVPLFDGHGLREWMIGLMKDSGKARSDGGQTDHALTLPRRPKLATVLDEEEDYHLFLGLMAFTRGFRVHAIASWDEANNLLGPNGRLIPLNGESIDTPEKRLRDENAGNHLLSLEDWYLSFPDQTVRHLSDMEQRQIALPVLGDSGRVRRRFVTVGHERLKERGQKRKAALRLIRIAERQAKGGSLRKDQQLVRKPLAGIYTLWHDLGLRHAYPNRDQPTGYAGLAPGFLWPPSSELPGFHPSVDDDADDIDGHSSSGRLLQIAEHLIDRCSAIIDVVNTLTESVRGAVLATQALELLGCKTPTLSVDALLLKHEFEVITECQFVGVEYHLSMRERLDDVAKTLKTSSQWLHPANRFEFRLNSEAKIITRLIAVLDEYGEYEESETCQIQLRRLHRKIGFNHDLRNKNLFRLLLAPVNLYVDVVLRSLAHYVAVMFSFFALFVVCYCWADKSHNLLQANHSVIGFMVGELPGDTEFKNLGILQMAIMYSCLAFGVLNFGLIVSHLYSKMVRR